MNKLKSTMNIIDGQSFIWNIIGSVLSAGSSFILLMCVTRAVGADEGGIFSLAFASAQLLLTVGKYGVRSFQATDVTCRIQGSTYLVSRIISCTTMMILCIIMIWGFHYDSHKGGIVFAVCIIKMVDAVEDVYHGQLQLKNRLYVAGQLLAFRNLFTMCLFAIVIFATQNLFFACWITGIVSLLVCVIFNHRVIAKYEKITLRWNLNEMKELMLSCFPLFLGAFLSLYIYNAPKYAIDLYCSSEQQTYYAIIFMPAFVINMFSEFVFKPLLTSLANWWNDGETEYFVKAVSKMIGYIYIITIVVCIGMYFVGAMLLSIIYSVDVMPYRKELVILMLGGGFSASVYFLYNVLTAMRKQKEILFNYLFGAIGITVIAFLSIKSGELTAAALSYLFTEMILCGLMLKSLYCEERIKYSRKGKDYVDIN